MDEISAIKGMEEGMNNSYQVIMGNITIEEIMLEYTGDGLFFAHDVERGATQDDIKNIKEYFEKMEDYEKCFELATLIL